MTADEEAKWVEEKEANWKAGEGARLFKQQQVNRELAYPSIGTQLDMLWHAMDAGEIPVCKYFYEAIKAVKDKYPMVEYNV